MTDGTPAKRKLIEVALPLEAINAASAREKSIRHGHPSTLHLWWARRPLAACRAVLFASLVDDPSSDPDRFPTPKAVEDERTRLFGIIERLVQWENSTNEAVLDEARAEIRRSTGGNPPPVLDPFCGGGSIPLEAQRLGLTAYASDLNPVAVLITKAMIEIPSRFASMPPIHPHARRGIGSTGSWMGASGLAEDIRRYGAWMRDEAERRIGFLYPKVQLPKDLGGTEATVIAWLWARTISCPNPACGASMPLITSFDLSRRPGSESWIAPIRDEVRKDLSFSVVGRSGGRAPTSPKVGRGASFRCLVCGQVAPEEHVRVEGQAGRMGATLTAVVAEGPRGRVFLAPDQTQREASAAAAPTWVPDLALSTNARHSTPPTYGMTSLANLFTPRQLVTLATLADLVDEARARAYGDAVAAGLPDVAAGGAAANAREYADAVATYLGLAVGRMSDLNNNLCQWRPDAGKLHVGHMFARQAYPMVWDFAEANPVGPSAGGWEKTFEFIPKAVECLPSTGHGQAIQADAAAAPFPRLMGDDPGALVSTDPPYYDNVPYADLSDFFYVWLRRALRGVHPGLLETLLTPKTTELVADPVRHGGRERARDHFEGGLIRVFSSIRDVAAPEYPVSVYYAFKQAEAAKGRSQVREAPVSTGWETMLAGLLSAGLAVLGTWPLRSELGNRMRSIDSNALASSIVLVCRPRSIDAGITTRKDFVAILKREMPEALRTLQHGNIAPVDLAQSAIGPGMAIFSRYAKVLEPDGSAMRVRTSLALINQVLDEILAEQEGDFDADTRWAIAWYEQFGLAPADSGRAILLTQAKDTSLGGLESAGIIEARRGKTRLLPRGEYKSPWDPSADIRVPVWEAMQRLVRALLTDGELPAAKLLAQLGGHGNAARDLAYRLYQIAERNGWTEEARAYNALVVAWTDLARDAVTTAATLPAQPSLGLE